MPVSSTQHRVSSGTYQYKNIKNNTISAQNITSEHLSVPDEICSFGNNISQAINYYGEWRSLSFQHRAPSQSVIVPMLLLLSQVRLNDAPLDKPSFISGRNVFLQPSGNTIHSDDDFNTLLSPVINALYKAGDIFSRYDPLKFPGADAVSLSVKNSESVNTPDRHFLSENLTNSTNELISTITNSKEKAAIREIVDKLNNLAIEAEKTFPSSPSGTRSIEHLIYLIDKSKHLIDNFEIKYGYENVCNTFKLQHDNYIKSAIDRSDYNSKLTFKNYVESLPVLTFTPDSRGEGYPSVESQIAGNLIRSVFWFENEQGHSAVYGSRYEAHKSFLTSLLAEKNIGGMHNLPEGWYKGDEAIRLMNLLYRDLEHNLKTKGEKYLLRSAEMFYQSLRGIYTTDSTLEIEGLQKKTLVSYSDKDKLAVLRHYFNQPVEIEYNQEPRVMKFFKLLDLFITIQCIAKVMHPGHLPSGKKNGYGHHYQTKSGSYRTLSHQHRKNIDKLKLEYNSNNHELTVRVNTGSKHRIKENDFEMKSILDANEKIEKITFKTNPSLVNKKQPSYMSKEMKNRITPGMYAGDVKIDDLSLPDKMGLRHSPSGEKYLKINGNLVEIHHIASHPDIKNRYVIKDEKNKSLYFRFHSDGKFHSETPGELRYVNKKIGFGRKPPKVTPPTEALTSNERYALHTYGRTGSDDINEFMSEGMPENHLTPFLRAPMVKIIDDIHDALKKIPPYKGVVYRGTTLTNQQFNSLKKDQLVTSKAFLSCSKNKEVATRFSTPFINTRRPVIYEFNIKKSGHSIEKYTEKFYEEEVLIENNQYFKIREINSKTIILDEMDSALLSDAEKAIAKNIDYKI
ncbi:ADP-ribosyltransferase [Klebsiella sp. BIGb0407]|uniref:ADP-ribosyltransferase n=1 Tax=Klebsiella sp. BIGb0407 TaxID=2940603 RepID=UPI00216A1AEA|nr:ADP-ribosyltransferase [Klebsiella sp. BIGb0407]MCS3430345.1 hypothetical protein [Klebsiella sp. BIGb0407]